MNEMTVKNAAKINLSLDVTGKLPNGYHTIESVFQTVGIYDEITLKLTKSGISVSCSTPEVFSASDEIPCGEKNIAYKAAKLFFDETGFSAGCDIHIRKGIPSQAGMGGGSSDAAAVLYILNKLTGIRLSSDRLSEIGAKIGADVPFFLTGGTAYVCGFGEKIAPIADYSGKQLVIAKGADGVSTAEAYSRIDSLENPVHPQTDSLVQAINSGQPAYRFFGNLFEDAVKLESVDNIKKIMLGNGSLASVMTGSGSAVFGLFENKKDAMQCASALASDGCFAQVCETTSNAFIESE
jgi:4-diphosphocytidyl-2-C-methyl-D-erythritol kinase